MRPRSWHGLDMLGRRAVPFVLSLGLIVASVLPWPLPGATTMAPMPLVAAVFYWTVHRPDLMPATMVFLLGLLQDTLTGGPLGLTALILLVAQIGLAGQSRHIARGPFLLELMAFTVTAAGFAAASWLCTTVYYGRLASPHPLLLQFLLGLCFYPILNWVFGLTYRRRPDGLT